MRAGAWIATTLGALIACGPAAWADEPGISGVANGTLRDVAEMSRSIEVKPGFARIVRSSRPAHTVAVGDPGIAEAAVAHLNVIVVTGKSIGATNMIVLDEQGLEISSVTIYVVDRPDTNPPGAREDRREVRVYTFGKDLREARSQFYLCSSGCSAIPLRGP